MTIANSNWQRNQVDNNMNIMGNVFGFIRCPMIHLTNVTITNNTGSTYIQQTKQSLFQNVHYKNNIVTGMVYPGLEVRERKKSRDII
jgi:hypothetical protein